MRKICPICDQELNEDLWCEHCKRRVALYKTVSDDAGSPSGSSNSVLSAPSGIFDSQEEALRRELQKRFVASLHALQRSKSRLIDPMQTHAVGRSSAAEKKPLTTAPAPSASRRSAVQPYDIKPENQRSFRIFVFSLAAVAAVSVFAALLYLPLSKPPVDAPAPDFFTETAPSTAASQISPENTTGPETTPTSDAPASDAEDVQDQQASSMPASDTETAQASSQPAEEKGDENLYLENEKKILQLTPLLTTGYGGDYVFHYYSIADIRKLGVECTYYHIKSTPGPLLPLLEDYFSLWAHAVDSSDGHPAERSMYYNYYAGDFSSYYTMFQSFVTYETEKFSCQLNYDTASENLHFISLYGSETLEHIGFLHTLLAAVSPEYTLPEQKLRDNVQTAQTRLLQIPSVTEGEEWREARLYEDSLISVSLICHGKTAEIQINSRAFTDAMKLDPYGGCWVEKEGAGDAGEVFWETQETDADGKIYSNAWRIMETLTPVSEKEMNQQKFYYYDSEDIRPTGLTCDYYHLNATREALLSILDPYFAPYPYRIDDWEVGNYYADVEDYFYLMFQRRMLYTADPFRCMIDYDTGSDVLHHIYLYFDTTGENLQNHIGLAQEILSFLSPEYDLSQEEFLQLFLTSDMFVDGAINYFYRDSNICLSLYEGANEIELHIFPILCAEASTGKVSTIGRRYKK